MTTFCVDPGVNGGVVVAHGDTIGDVFPMPENFVELAEQLTRHLHAKHNRMFIELVSGYIGDAHPGSRMFTFGTNFGWFQGFAAGAGFKSGFITPFSWQQRLGLGLRSECLDSPAWKRKLKAEAVRRFPSWKPTLKTADALLLWDFVRVHRPWRASATAVEA